MAVNELKVLQDIDLSQNKVNNVSEILNSSGVILKKDDNIQVSLDDRGISIKNNNSSISITSDDITLSAENFSIGDKITNNGIKVDKLTVSNIEGLTKLSTDSLTIKNVKIYWDDTLNSLVFEKA